jgi:uncharacterized OB-fold protein
MNSGVIGADAGPEVARRLADLAPLSSATLPFWAGASENKLVLPRCDRCHRLVAYAREVCPRCGWASLTWEELDGRGTVYSYTIIRQSRSPAWQQKVPYVGAVVELEPGARLNTRLIDSDPSEVSVGMPVEVAFEALEDGLRIPVFRPARA